MTFAATDRIFNETTQKSKKNKRNEKRNKERNINLYWGKKRNSYYSDSLKDQQ